jgi:hypothetical protein
VLSKETDKNKRGDIYYVFDVNRNIFEVSNAVYKVTSRQKG